MTPTEHCFAKLREMCLKHDPSLAIALDLVLEDMAAEASAPSATGPETGQISQDAPPNPACPQWTREGYPFDTSAPNGGQETTIGLDGDETDEWLTRLGVKIVTDPALPPDVVEERHDGRIVARVHNLADPTKAIRELNDLPEEPLSPEELDATTGVNPYTAGAPQEELPGVEVGDLCDPIRPPEVEPPQVDKEDEWEIPPRAYELPPSEKVALVARLHAAGLPERKIADKTGIPRGSINYLLKKARPGKGDAKVEPKVEEPTPEPPTPEPPKEGRPLPGYVADSHVRKVFDEALARCNGAPRGESVVKILRMGMERPGAPTKMADELELPATTVATVLNRYKPLLVAWRAFVSPVVRAYFGELVCKHVGGEAPSNP